MIPIFAQPAGRRGNPVCLRHVKLLFSPIYLYFLLFFIPFIVFALLFSPPPSRNSDLGSHSRLFSPLPTTVRALHFYREMASALSSLVDSRRHPTHPASVLFLHPREIPGHALLYDRVEVPYRTVHITPAPPGFSKLDCWTTKRVPIPNDT